MIAALMTMAVAAQIPADRPLTSEEARRAAGPVLEQMLGEASGAHYGVDYRGGAHATLWTRGRASDQPGVCEREQLRIEMDGAAAPPSAGQEPQARIRRVELERQFHVLRTDDDRLRGEVVDEALEAACADPDEAHASWIRAESGEDAWAAVLGLIAVRAALAEPSSPLIRVRCSHPRTCFSREGTRIWMSPFDQGAYPPSSRAGCAAATRRRCQRFFIVDLGRCQAWQLAMETELQAPYRVRAATFFGPGAVDHCPVEEN